MKKYIDEGVKKIKEKFPEINKKPVYILAAFFVFAIVAFIFVYVKKSDILTGPAGSGDAENTILSAKLAEIPDGYAIDPAINNKFEYFEKNVGFSSDGHTAMFAAHDKNGLGYVFVNELKYGPYQKNAEGYYASGFVFSANGKRSAFIAEKDGIQIAVIDGREEAKYEKISDLIFSPDGKKAGYIGLKGGLEFVVIAGLETKRLLPDSVLPGSLSFSSDGSSYSYMAKSNKLGGYSAFIEGQNAGEYNCSSPVIFAPKGNKWACVSRTETGVSLMIDGQYGKGYEFISPNRIFFSPDGMNVGYTVFSQGKNFTVVDGREGVLYDDVKGEVFSSDGKDVMYLALRDGKWFAVVGGSEEEIKDNIFENRIFFARSEESFGYMALHAGRKFFVFNGKNSPFYNEVYSDSVVIEENGENFAYVAKKFPSNILGESKNYLVALGREIEIDYLPTKIRFSSDGSVLFFGTVRNDKNIWWMAQKVSDIPEGSGQAAETGDEKKIDCPENNYKTAKELLSAAARTGASGDGEKFSCYFSGAMKNKFVEVFGNPEEVRSVARSMTGAKLMETGVGNDFLQTFEAKYFLDGNEYPMFIRVEKDPEGKWFISGF